MAVTSGDGWAATGGESPVKSTTTAEAPPRRRRGVGDVDIFVEATSVRVNGVLGVEMKTLPVNDPSTVTGAKTYLYRLRARSQTNEVQDIHAGQSGSFVVRRVRASAPLSFI